MHTETIAYIEIGELWMEHTTGGKKSRKLALPIIQAKTTTTRHFWTFDCTLFENQNFRLKTFNALNFEFAVSHCGEPFKTQNFLFSIFPIGEATKVIFGMNQWTEMKGKCFEFWATFIEIHFFPLLYCFFLFPFYFNTMESHLRADHFEMNFNANAVFKCILNGSQRTVTMLVPHGIHIVQGGAGSRTIC